ncbi:MAG: ribonuclease HII [Dehalococcoidia bacterium]
MGKPKSPTLRFEKTHWAEGSLVAGVDEVGRGPLAGPLVAAAVVLPQSSRRLKWCAGVRDSKIVPEPEREELCARILDNCEAVGLGLIQPWDLDLMGMTGAWNKAMHTALVNAGVKPDIVLIDGKMKISGWAAQRSFGQKDHEDWWAPTVPSPARIRFARQAQKPLPGIEPPEETTVEVVQVRNGHEMVYRQQTIVDGDAQCLSIAAASLVAKVARDHIMQVLHHEHPQYGWAENKGYSTPGHKRAIREHGTCVHHRLLFAPVREALQGLLFDA